MRSKFTQKILVLIPLVLGFIHHNMSSATNCKKIRFSDVGWTDITATTAVAMEVLNAMGYETKSMNLSLPITFAGLKNNDIDIFLGTWLPTMSADIKPYLEKGQIETIGTILKNAKYTLAVPQYVYDAGVKSMADLMQHRDKFQGKIFAIEPGNDGNRSIQNMISDNAYNLKDWRLIESSEQAMLMEVIQSFKKKKWIVFLGWQPHPMNHKIHMNYLSGGEKYFGPDHGISTVYINSRKNYSNECPEISLFFKNLNFSIEDENNLMDMILDKNMEPNRAAKIWIKSNLPKVEQWIKNVKQYDGKLASLQSIDQKISVSKK